jgi:hypothetical protein
MKKIILSLCAVAALASIAQAQISVTTSSLNYFQSFNGLPDTTASGTSAAFTLAGWQLDERGTGLLANDSIKAGNGNSNGGDTYSYGLAAGNTDRALGSLASGSVRSSYGAVFTNNTGTALDSVIITYLGEQYRCGDTITKPDTLYFHYSTSVTTIDSQMTGWTSVPSLDFLSPVTNVVGVVAGASTSLTQKIAVSIPVGGSFAIRFLDNNMGGSDDGLAVDDLAIQFVMQGGNPVTAPVAVSTTPGDNSTNVLMTTTSATVTFDQPITLGSGNITINNITDGTNTSVVVPSAAVTVAGATATISGLNLVCNKTYAIQYNGPCFVANGLNSAGINNNTDWNFAMEVCSALSDVKAVSVSALYVNGQVILATPKNAGQFVIANASGVVVSRGAINSSTTKIDVEGLAAGIYFVRVNLDGKLGVAKFALQ